MNWHLAWGSTRSHLSAHARADWFAAAVQVLKDTNDADAFYVALYGC